MKIYTPCLRGLAAAFLVANLLAATGCQVPQGSAGTGSGRPATYFAGDLETTFDGSYGDVISAANEALTELHFALPAQHNDGLVAVIDTDTAQNNHVHIVVTKVSSGVTNLSIRVDYLGDEQMSIAILNKIHSNFTALSYPTTG